MTGMTPIAVAANGRGLRRVEGNNERFDCVRKQTDRNALSLVAASTALTLSAAIALPAVSFADEDGVSFWLPGIYGSLAAVPQQPGFTFTAINYF